LKIEGVISTNRDEGWGLGRRRLIRMKREERHMMHARPHTDDTTADGSGMEVSRTKRDGALKRMISFDASTYRGADRAKVNVQL